MAHDAAGLLDARYFSLATFRRNGVAVATPVWFAPPADGDDVRNGVSNCVRQIYYVFSAADAGKVKRLRNNASARVAACDVRGRVLGKWVNARAELVSDASEVRAALGALGRKYGWQMRLTNGLARLSGRFERRAYIRVMIDEPSD